ncbi:MAG: hypothetical protein A2942_04665 [Candidatus Lloydbacteria bacterium RIFCSPLOWO2_01_FULL_50_20]|uniref:Uncharacterized protein n=1 Tax=Candidatus Lloydbacteria bacterium RIFCSPLOWO2_01_FULL_50_20 TaxID=1798665 RepID=A0A1G2DL21_9BACT|nr:MAG: hypothetical protein A3C13_03525 [Candidatus Lloydbacteria bacterium RIFCSPHIGHO2_02_FULL_50_11]OGZ13610.1 MAG: hypothetical protein A2942_04665 [Candidatus Lloydbacteria bacterium RIFCSPLOWO2_01_FULL_50_20]
MITAIEFFKLKGEILEATKEGRLQDWNERIGEIAQLAEFQLEKINWQGAPNELAARLIHYADVRSTIEKLAHALQKYRFSN